MSSSISSLRRSKYSSRHNPETRKRSPIFITRVAWQQQKTQENKHGNEPKHEKGSSLAGFHCPWVARNCKSCVIQIFSSFLMGHYIDPTPKTVLFNLSSFGIINFPVMVFCVFVNFSCCCLMGWDLEGAEHVMQLHLFWLLCKSMDIKPLFLMWLITWDQMRPPSLCTIVLLNNCKPAISSLVFRDV